MQQKNSQYFESGFLELEKILVGPFLKNFLGLEKKLADPFLAKEISEEAKKRKERQRRVRTLLEKSRNI